MQAKSNSTLGEASAFASLIPESIKADAARAYDAMRRAEWTVHSYICRRYPFGSDERRQFESEVKRLGDEWREANPPEPFK